MTEDEVDIWLTTTEYSAEWMIFFRKMADDANWCPSAKDLYECLSAEASDSSTLVNWEYAWNSWQRDLGARRTREVNPKSGYGEGGNSSGETFKQFYDRIRRHRKTLRVKRGVYQEGGRNNENRG